MQALLDQVIEIVEKSGDIVRKNDTMPRRIRHKGRIDLVTETDVAVEEYLKELLAPLVPGVGFMAEESASSLHVPDDAWIIDPLDGTTNFAHGLPFVGTSVALVREGEPVLGVVGLPLLGEMFTALKGGGTRLNGSEVSVSRCDDLQQALVATGFPYDTRRYLREILADMGDFLLATQGVRRPGAAALDLAYVACGRYDGFYECALKPWDTAAGVLLVTEAGGNISRYEHNAAYSLGDEDVLASNGGIHTAMSGILVPNMDLRGA